MCADMKKIELATRERVARNYADYEAAIYCRQSHAALVLQCLADSIEMLKEFDRESDNRWAFLMKERDIDWARFSA